MLLSNEITKLIRFAWIDAMPPLSNAISASIWDEGVSEFFVGKPWHALSAAQLRRFDFAPNIFTDEAFAYYLPAYMIGDIEEPEISDTNSERVLYWLSANRGLAVISKLSNMQRSATRAYIEFIQNREPGMYDCECTVILESLNTHS